MSSRTRSRTENRLQSDCRIRTENRNQSGNPQRLVAGRVGLFNLPGGTVIPRRNSGAESEAPRLPPRTKSRTENRWGADCRGRTQNRNQSGHTQRWVAWRVGSSHRTAMPRFPIRNEREIHRRQSSFSSEAILEWTANDVADNIRFQRTWLLSRFLLTQEHAPA